MPDPFKSARLKLDRAQRHINDLHVCVEEFKTLANNRREIVVEEDLEPGYKVHKFRLLEPVPYDEFSVMIGDAVNNIRAALDHVIYACAVTNGHADPVFRTCNFPFGKNLIAFENAIKGCAAVHEDIRMCLRQFKAYDGGNTPLWTLNNMCNRDKHALITPVLTGFNYLALNIRPGTGAVEMNGPTGWDSTKHEMNLFRTNQEPQYDFTYAVDVAFDTPPFLQGHRPVPILNHFANVVECVLVAIEAETRRLFPDAFL